MKKTLILLTMLFAFLSLTSISYAQITTEEDMATAVFETIQNNDSEALSYYCISEKRMAKAINGVADTSHVARSVVSDLKEANSEKMRYAVINSFDKFITEVEKENLILKDAKFEGVIMNKIKFDIGDLKGKKVHFKVSFGDVNYTVMMFLFKTNTDIFIAGFDFNKIDIKR